MLSVPYVLANFNQIRNVSADFFGKKCAISKFSTEIRARCVKTGKRTDMTRLTGVSPSPPPATTRTRDQSTFPPQQIFLQILPAVLQFVTRGPTDEHARRISATLPREGFAISRGEGITVSCSAGTRTDALGRWSALDLSNPAALCSDLWGRK